MLSAAVVIGAVRVNQRSYFAHGIYSHLHVVQTEENTCTCRSLAFFTCPLPGWKPTGPDFPTLSTNPAFPQLCQDRKLQDQLSPLFVRPFSPPFARMETYPQTYKLSFPHTFLTLCQDGNLHPALPTLCKDGNLQVQLTLPFTRIQTYKSSSPPPLSGWKPALPTIWQDGNLQVQLTLPFARI